MPPLKLRMQQMNPLYIPNESNGQNKTQSHVSLSENHVSGYAYPVSASSNYHDNSTFIKSNFGAPAAPEKMG